jgi:NTP pyrophosphatase (non-canonical NTP hydrolase)
VTTLNCTISGSFRRFLEQVKAAMRDCAENEVNVLSPRSGSVIGEENGFVFLEGDSGEPKDIEAHHLQSIRRSDFLFVVNPDGYIGPNATLEVGYALALSVPVFCLQVPSETVLAEFVHSGVSIAEVKRAIKQGPGLIPRGADLSTLQAYIRNVVKLRGFDDESVRDVVLLLVEEVGELAKAVRRQIGLKVEATNRDNVKTIADEVADCLIYLLDIANLVGLDLEIALRSKEEINAKKTWVSENPGLYD